MKQAGKQKEFILGVSANLDPAGSVHMQTFVRAVNMAWEHLASDLANPVKLVWQNDHATYEGGKKAAGLLKEAGADLVVGHYASSAAKGALPVYEAAGIPVLLPAASADALTRDFKNAFRVCRNDSSLAHFIFQFISGLGRYRKISILHDHSIHGSSLSAILVERFSFAYQIVEFDARPDAVIYVGSFKNSIAFLESFRMHNKDCPVYFTDDVVSSDIIRETKHRDNIYIFGHAPGWEYPTAEQINKEYKRVYADFPAVYFLETYAAIQIALYCFKNPLFENAKTSILANTEWNTVLGEMSFVEGETNNTRFSLWTVHGAMLLPLHKN